MSDIQDEEPRKIGLLVLQPFCSNFFHQDLRRCHQGVVGVIDDKAGGRACGFFDVLFLDIVDLHLVVSTAFGVVGGQGAGLLEDPVGKLLALRLDDDMRAGDTFGVEPPVISRGNLEGQLLVLVIVLAHIDVETVGGQVVEGTAGDLRLLSLPIVALDIAVFRQLLLDLYQIILL